MTLPPRPEFAGSIGRGVESVKLEMTCARSVFLNYARVSSVGFVGRTYVHTLGLNADPHHFLPSPQSELGAEFNGGDEVVLQLPVNLHCILFDLARTVRD